MLVPLTDEWIEQQLELCKAASQAPWYDGFDDGSGRIDNDNGADITFGELDPRDGLPQGVIEGGNYEGVPIGVLKQEDVDFIIATREGYLLVLKEVQRLRRGIHFIVSELR